MRGWLALYAAFGLASATRADAQLKLVPTVIPSPAHTADFSVPGDTWTNDPAPLAGGMITTDEMGANTMLGVGLVKMHGRTRRGSELQAGAADVQKRNPAVTFVLKF